MIPLKAGDRAPDFKLLDQKGASISLSDFRSQKILLYFYPKADTSGCTAQSCSVRDEKKGLLRFGISALGISPDPVERQKKFDDKYELGFPLLSDPDRKTIGAYGVWGEKSMYGRKYMGVIRSAFLIGENGKVEAAWYKVSPAKTVPNVRAFLAQETPPSKKPSR